MPVIATMRDRLTEQLAPIAPLVRDVVRDAYANGNERTVAGKIAHVRRPAHVKRLAGLSRWAAVADDLVAAHEAERFPTGFAVLSSDAEHNGGRYAFGFPGGVFSVRRLPHDDEAKEGLFLQQTLDGVVELMDRQGAPDASEAVRVWMCVADNDETTFTARDRHGHEVTVGLDDLLRVSAATVHDANAPRPARTTRVRSTRPTGSEATQE